MKAIHKILKIDDQAYRDYQFTCFFKWCDYYTEYGLPLQAMVNNKQLFKWYCQQWKGVVEKAFKKDNQAYIEANIQDAKIYLELLASYPQVIDAYYPSAIFKKIQTQLETTTNHGTIHPNPAGE